MPRIDTRTLVVLLNGMDNDWSFWTEVPDRTGVQFVGRRQLSTDGKLYREIIESNSAVKALEQMMESAGKFLDEAKDFMSTVDMEKSNAS